MELISVLASTLEKMGDSSAVQNIWYKDSIMDQKVFYNVGQLDQPTYLQNKMQLTDLSDESKDNLKEQGYGEKTVEAIRSEEEAEIYKEAGLESKEINGISYKSKKSFKCLVIELDAKLEKTESIFSTLLENGISESKIFISSEKV